MINKSLTDAGKICEEYLEIAGHEHTTHEVVQYGDGVVRWKENIEVIDLMAQKYVGSRKMIMKLQELGVDKNNETYRDFYRSLGWSLSAYHDAFYTDGCNDKLDDYIYSSKSNLIEILKDMKDD